MRPTPKSCTLRGTGSTKTKPKMIEQIDGIIESAEYKTAAGSNSKFIQIAPLSLLNLDITWISFYSKDAQYFLLKISGVIEDVETGLTCTKTVYVWPPYQDFIRIVPTPSELAAPAATCKNLLQHAILTRELENANRRLFDEYERVANFGEFGCAYLFGKKISCLVQQNNNGLLSLTRVLSLTN